MMSGHFKLELTNKNVLMTDRYYCFSYCNFMSISLGEGALCPGSTEHPRAGRDGGPPEDGGASKPQRPGRVRWARGQEVTPLPGRPKHRRMSGQGAEADHERPRMSHPGVGRCRGPSVSGGGSVAMALRGAVWTGAVRADTAGVPVAEAELTW